MLLNSDPEQKSSPVRMNADVRLKKKFSNRRRSLAKLATFSSFLCSTVAASLIAGNFFGPKNFFANKIVCEACNRVQGILIASVLLGIFAMIITPGEYDARYFGDLCPEQRASQIRSIDKGPKAESKSGTLHENVCATTYACKSKSKTRNSKNKQKTEDANCNPSHIELHKKKDILPINLSPSHSPSNNERAVVLYRGNHTGLKKGYIETSSNILQLPGHSSNRVPLLWTLDSFDSSRKQTVTEFVASRRMTYFSEEGKIQGLEELTMKRVTNFNLDPKTKYQSRGRQDTSMKRSIEYSHRKFVDPTQCGSTYTPQNDHVSEVITKMEALQFFY